MKKVIHFLRKYPFWALGLLLICGCEVVQDIISEPSGDMDAPTASRHHDISKRLHRGFILL